MQRDALMEWLGQANVKSRLLPRYCGPCSISVMASPDPAGEVAIRVRVPRHAEVQAVPSVVLEGETVEVFVEYTYLPLKSHLCS